MSSVAIRLMVALGLSVALSAHAQTPHRLTAFERATIIVGNESEPIENGTLLVDGEKIVAVGPAADIRIPAQARRVSLAGKTLMPAIIDTHVHTPQAREDLILDLRRRAYFGVGAVMSLGLDTEAEPFQVRDAPVPGAARFLTAGRGITAPEPGRPTAPIWVESEEQALAAVRENAARKADIVKIWVDSRNGKYEKLPPQLYRAIIEEAHKRDLKVIAHIFELDDAKRLVDAGVDAFAHGIRDRAVDEEFLQSVRERGDFVLGANLGARGVKNDLDWLRGALPAAELKELEAANVDRADAQARFGIEARNLKRMHDAGVRIVLGTDAFAATPWAPHVEMQDMVASGLTPKQVMVAATRNGAEFLGLQDAGTLEAGKSADFIVLDANPLDDITNTRAISAVYLRGSEVDRTKYP